jgi:hypothetical protein
MGHAVKALRTIYPDATFAIDPRVVEVPLTDLIVRADDPMTDLEALCTSCGGRFRIVHSPNFPSASGVAEQNQLYTVEYNNATDQKPTTQQDHKIECFNLTPYLQRVKATEKDEANTNKSPGGGFGSSTRAEQAITRLQEIIQKSITDFDSSISQPHFQFYGDAQMLIVIGPRQALEVAAKVIHALPGQPAFFGNDLRGGGDVFGSGDSPDLPGNLQQLQRNVQEMRAAADAMKRDMILKRDMLPDLSQPAVESNPGRKP